MFISGYELGLIGIIAVIVVVVAVDLYVSKRSGE